MATSNRISALPPPPGVTANFVNPASRRPQIIAIAIIFPVLAFIAIALRLYTRLFVSRAFGLDDGILLIYGLRLEESKANRSLCRGVSLSALALLAIV